MGQNILLPIEELSAGLKLRCEGYISESSEQAEAIWEKVPLNKVQWALSADQIGILLKAAYDTRLVLAKSFWVVCKSVAPHLSTPWREQIFWDTIRSNAGRTEKRDKAITIEFLERMIYLIRE